MRASLIALAVGLVLIVVVLGVATWLLSAPAPGPAVWLTPSGSPS